MTTQPLPVTASLRGASATAGAERRGETLLTIGSRGRYTAGRGPTPPGPRRGTTPLRQYQSRKISRRHACNSGCVIAGAGVGRNAESTDRDVPYDREWIRPVAAVDGYADATKRPVLRVTYSDGSTSDINPTVDVSIDGSSPDMRDGKNVTLNVSGSARNDLAVSQARCCEKAGRIRSTEDVLLFEPELRRYRDQRFIGSSAGHRHASGCSSGHQRRICERSGDGWRPRVVDVMNLNDSSVGRSGDAKLEYRSPRAGRRGAPCQANLHHQDVRLRQQSRAR